MTAAERRARIVGHWDEAARTPQSFTGALLDFADRVIADAELRAPRCRCGHARPIHSMGPRNVCASEKCKCQKFVEAA